MSGIDAKLREAPNIGQGPACKSVHGNTMPSRRRVRDRNSQEPIVRTAVDDVRRVLNEIRADRGDETNCFMFEVVKRANHTQPISLHGSRSLRSHVSYSVEGSPQHEQADCAV